MEVMEPRNEGTGLRDLLNGYMTLNAAAKRLKMTRYAVLIRIVAKNIEAEVFAGHVMVRTDSIDQFLADSRPATNPAAA